MCGGTHLGGCGGSKRALDPDVQKQRSMNSSWGCSPISNMEESTRAA